MQVDTAVLGLSARDLAARIAAGEVSALEAVEAAIARIEAVNARLNAVVVKRYDAAREEARAADAARARGESLGPLHGVPITIKESLDLTGTPSTFGISTLASTTAERDDPYVARMRAAGAIVVGKTNVPQLLLYIETDNPVYGRSNNPWNLERTPGGSSGGQAAVLAAGATPLGLGTDIGGSLRFPAAFCGITALMPTAGRTSDAGRFSVPVGETAIVSQVGPMARTVADLTFALGILNGPTAQHPAQPLGDPESVDVSKLRVAYFFDDGIHPVAESVRRAVTEAAGTLAGRGAQVTEWQPPAMRQAADLWLGIIAADGARTYKRILRGSKKDPRIANQLLLAARSRPMVAVLRTLMRLAGQRDLARVARNFGHSDTTHYWDLVAAQREYQRRFAAALEGDPGGPFDVIISPVCPVPAIRHGASAYLTTAGAYTVLYNVLGYPAGVVPVSRVRPEEERPRRNSRDLAVRALRQAESGSAGLPLAVQVAAHPWQEHVALAAMRVIEEAARTSPDYPAQAPL